MFRSDNFIVIIDFLYCLSCLECFDMSHMRYVVAKRPLQARSHRACFVLVTSHVARIYLIDTTVEAV
jgi:hypothetical protein